MGATFAHLHICKGFKAQPVSIPILLSKIGDVLETELSRLRGFQALHGFKLFPDHLSVQTYLEGVPQFKMSRKSALILMELIGQSLLSSLGAFFEGPLYSTLIPFRVTEWS